MTVESEAIVPRVEMMRTASALALIRPIAQPADLLALHDDVAKIIQENLKQDTDYGTVPGTSDKPSLFKPGAEKLNLAFGAVAEIEVIEKEVDHDREVRWTKRQKVWNNKFSGDRTYSWKETEGTSFGLYRYVIICKLVREGRVLAHGVGSCSTLESKYIDRPRDCENVVFKMAKKRAYIDATLTAYALSNRFTQDVEDLPHLHKKANSTLNNKTNPREDRRYTEKDYFDDLDEPPHPGEMRANAPSEQGPAKDSPPPRKASVYNHEDAGMQKTVAEILSAQKIDPAYWNEIGERLHGKPSTELKKVITEVLKGSKA